MRGLVVPEQAEDYTADQVELFFDLAFVFAFSQLVGVLVADPTWETVGQAGLVFVLLWLPWTQFTWAANAVPGNARNVRILFLVATAASVPMAAAVSSAFEDGGPLLAIPLVVIMLMGIGLMVIALEDDPEQAARYRSSAIAYAIPNLLAALVIVVGGFLDDGARVAAWLVGIAIFVASTIWAGGADWILRAGHFAERHGLIIIVALGEVIVAIGSPLADSLQEGAGIPAESTVALTASGVFAGLLWWSYFDRPQPALEHRLEQTDAPSRARLARDVYSYAHLPIVAGVVAAAAALEEITLHPGDALGLPFRLLMLGGLLLFFGGVDIAVQRAFGVIALERLVAAAVIAALLLVGADLDGVVLLVLIDAIVLVMLAVENWRVEVSGRVFRIHSR
jgi:low temperature requirement protein LtrA